MYREVLRAPHEVVHRVIMCTVLGDDEMRERKLVRVVLYARYLSVNNRLLNWFHLHVAFFEHRFCCLGYVAGRLAFDSLLGGQAVVTGVSPSPPPQ